MNCLNYRVLTGILRKCHEARHREIMACAGRGYDYISDASVTACRHAEYFDAMMAPTVHAEILSSFRKLNSSKASTLARNFTFRKWRPEVVTFDYKDLAGIQVSRFYDAEGEAWNKWFFRDVTRSHAATLKQLSQIMPMQFDDWEWRDPEGKHWHHTTPPLRRDSRWLRLWFKEKDGSFVDHASQSLMVNNFRWQTDDAGLRLDTKAPHLWCNETKDMRVSTGSQAVVFDFANEPVCMTRWYGWDSRLPIGNNSVVIEMMKETLSSLMRFVKDQPEPERWKVVVTMSEPNEVGAVAGDSPPSLQLSRQLGLSLPVIAAYQVGDNVDARQNFVGSHAHWVYQPWFGLKMYFLPAVDDKSEILCKPFCHGGWRHHYRKNLPQAKSRWFGTGQAAVDYLGGLYIMEGLPC